MQLMQLCNIFIQLQTINGRAIGLDWFSFYAHIHTHITFRDTCIRHIMLVQARACCTSESRTIYVARWRNHKTGARNLYTPNIVYSKCIRYDTAKSYIFRVSPGLKTFACARGARERERDTFMLWWWFKWNTILNTLWMWVIWMWRWCVRICALPAST